MKEVDSDGEIVLALETSVKGGSLSLSKNGREIDFWQGAGNLTKSEDVLDAISKILKSNSIDKAQIKTIVVSRGPGSFTGTRIGLAIARGLSKSLGCEIVGVSVLKAMALQTGRAEKIITGIGIGLKVCLQQFHIVGNSALEEDSDPYLLSLEEFIKLLVEVSDAKIILNGELFEMVVKEIKAKQDTLEKLIWNKENLAFLITRAARKLSNRQELEPIYIRELKKS